MHIQDRWPVAPNVENQNLIPNNNILGFIPSQKPCISDDYFGKTFMQKSHDSRLISRTKNPDFDEIVSGTSSGTQENCLPRRSINFDQKLDSNGFMGVNEEKFKKV